MKKIIIGALIGLFLGFALGVWFYAKVLDKPEIVNNNDIKQKIKRNTIRDLFAPNETK